MTISEFQAEFFRLVENANHIVITAHYSPDDDSIASVLSTYTIITTKYPGTAVRIVYTGVPSERHRSFLNFENIEWVEDVAYHLDDTDLLIVLDVNRFARISKVPEVIAALHIPTTIALDHHGSTPDPFTLSLILSEYSSNAQLIYDALGAESMLTKELAELFLLGILGDTANFSHVSPSQSGVFLTVRRIIEAVGESIDAFRARYGGIPKRIIPLLQMLVQHTTYSSVEGWPEAQYTYIDRSILREGGYTDEDMSAASHIYMGQYLPKVQGVSWGFVVTPREDGSNRISGRSLPGSVNVRDMFERMGLGGGHDRAAGAYLGPDAGAGDGEQGVLFILEWMKKNQPLIG